jgi:hypothetical protein
VRLVWKQDIYEVMMKFPTVVMLSMDVIVGKAELRMCRGGYLRTKE